MKKLLRTAVLLTALGLTGVFSYAAAASSSRFAEANAKYAAGDFKAAAALYREIIDSKKATAAAYYNLGNADLRLGKKGAALVSYERALRITPRDKDLRWNVNILRNALADRIEDGGENIAVTFLRRTVRFVTIDELAMLFAGALGLLAFLAAVRFFLASSKPWTGTLQGLVWMIVIVVGVLFAFKWELVKDPRVVVLEPEVYAHYGPSDKETKAFMIHEGAEGKVMDESKGWYYIVLKDKNTGWIPKESCEVV